MALIRYQLEPDFALGHTALQCDPLTVATTVSRAVVAGRVSMADVVDAPVRRFTAEHAGTIVEVGLGVGVRATDPVAGPPSGESPRRGGRPGRPSLRTGRPGHIRWSSS